MKTKTVQALEIVHKNRINSGRQFGGLLWPDMEPGRARSLAGGSFLGKLNRAGLINYSNAEGRYLVTEEGLAVIDASEAPKAQLSFLPEPEKEG